MIRKSIGVNATLNVVRSCLSVLFPLIIYPYVFKVLGADNIGVVTYGTSIVSYFMIIASLGMGSYAIREGAKCKSDKRNFESFCNEVFSINVLFTVFSYILLICTLCCIKKLQPYVLIISIQSLAIIFETLSINWLNTIFEDYLYITIRSIIAYIVSLVLTFVFINSPEDYLRYSMIQILPQGIAGIANWIYCRRYIKLRLTMRLNIKQHIQPILLFFANTVAVSIYVNIDTVMLGWMLGNNSVGIYTAAVKIYTVIKTVLSSIYIVAISRFSMFHSEKQMLQYRQLFTEMVGALTLLVLPICCGLVCVSKELLVIIAGEGYIQGVLSLQILSVSLVFALFGGVVTACLNIPLGREKENMIATIGSALINFFLNLMIIPKFGPTGAAITTALSELFVLCFCYCRIPIKSDYISIREIVPNFIASLLECMFIIVAHILLKSQLGDTFLEMIMLILCAIVSYTIILIVTKNSLFFNLISKVLNKIKRD